MPPDESWLTTLAIGAIALLVAAGFVCWAGAQLAAITFGDGALSAGPETGVPALLQLPSRLDDPASAWPAPERASLPGPGFYWACTTLIGILAGTLAGAGVWAWLRWTRRDAIALGVKRNAGFARLADLRRLVVPEPQPGRLTLGRVGRRLVAAEPQVSLAVVGPTGCGKTAGFAIPALLEWHGPVIATSVKADLIDAAVDHRRQRGTVWIYDPTRSSGHPTSRWSPLHGCVTWGDAMRVAAWLCEAAQPRADTVNDGDYWYTQARKALAPYLHAAAVGNKTMRDVVRWVDTQEQAEVGAILRRHAGADEALSRLLASDEADGRRAELSPQIRRDEVAVVREQLSLLGGGGRHSWEMQDVSHWPLEQQQQLRARADEQLERQLTLEFFDKAMAEARGAGQLDALIAAESLWDKEQRLRGSVFATVENVLSGYADPGIADAADSCDLDLDEWLSGDNTIFVVASAHEQARLRPVLTVLLQQAIRTAYDRASARGGALAEPCLVLLDEAGNIAPLRDLPGYASTARSHGITLVSIWQDLAQIKAIYGDRSQTVLNNHRAKLFGTGIADEATLEYISRLIGDERRTEINLSGDVHGGRRTMSEHVTYRRAAPADLVRRMQPNEAVLVYGSELPAHVKLRPWYEK